MCTQPQPRAQARGPNGSPLSRPDPRDPAQRGGGGASGCGSEEEGWGPVGGDPPVSGVGVSPLPTKRGSHHTPGALQPGTPGDGGVAELEARTRIEVRVPSVLC